MGKVISVLVVFFFGFWHVHARADNFARTAEEIIDALTNTETEQEIKTRSLKQSNGKTRGLTIIKKEDGNIVEKTSLISERDSVRSANIKVEFDSRQPPKDGACKIRFPVFKGFADKKPSECIAQI